MIKNIKKNVITLIGFLINIGCFSFEARSARDDSTQNRRKSPVSEIDQKLKGLHLVYYKEVQLSSRYIRQNNWWINNQTKRTGKIGLDETENLRPYPYIAHS